MNHATTYLKQEYTRRIKMKAEKYTPTFIPVTLTLESQGEVDAIFSLLNHPRITNAVNLTTSAYKVLQPFVSSERDSLHVNLCKIIKDA